MICIFSKDYNGPREANGIIKYMKAQVGPASSELKTKADLDKIRWGEQLEICEFTNISLSILFLGRRQRWWSSASTRTRRRTRLSRR